MFRKEAAKVVQDKKRLKQIEKDAANLEKVMGRARVDGDDDAIGDNEIGEDIPEPASASNILHPAPKQPHELTSESSASSSLFPPPSNANPRQPAPPASKPQKKGSKRRRLNDTLGSEHYIAGTTFPPSTSTSWVVETPESYSVAESSKPKAKSSKS